MKNIRNEARTKSMEVEIKLNKKLQDEDELTKIRPVKFDFQNKYLGSKIATIQLIDAMQ